MGKKLKNFKTACELAEYGVGFQKDFRNEEDSAYLLGVIEATGYIVSCYLVQHCGFESIGGVEVVEELKLDFYPSGKKIRKRMKKLFKRESEGGFYSDSGTGGPEEFETDENDGS